MKKSLSFKDSIMIASMLFGMFFGAGNLIFPIHMGQLAGRNIIPALIGFIVTGVGLPVLGVAALGKSHCSGLYELGQRRLGKAYSLFFTCALYLTIGPFFAMPRCATVSFAVGFQSENRLGLLIFSALFFAVSLLFALKPGKLMVYIGKYLNPLFLLFFGALIVVALVKPMTSLSAVEPDSAYASGAFFKGFLEGYNTMDALAGLCFGVLVVNSIKSRGVTDPSDVAAESARSGVFCALVMALIYTGACLIGTLSRGGFATSENGGIALSQISEYYFGGAGKVFLAVLVTVACLKTSIGMLTSIAGTFSDLFTKRKGYRWWAVGFAFLSFAISNVGLNTIIKLSVPVLMFLYPLTITIMILSLCGDLFGNDRRVYIAVTVFTMVGALPDFLGGLGIQWLETPAQRFLPFYSLGLGWLVPALIGLALGVILHAVNRRRTAPAEP